ncbi:MAG TPA: response regulator [Pseudomonadales bacterium]
MLLVEDEAGTQDALATLLRMDGWQVLTAYDGVEALALLEEHIPDVVVTDYMMPNVDGLELIERIRSTPALLELPVVLTSATRLDRDSYRNAEAFLPKPINLPELRKVLVTLVRRRG